MEEGGTGRDAQRARAEPAGDGPARQRVGARGEDLAVAELVSQGMQILVRNWRCKLGEIDVIAMEWTEGRRTLVFCEVKCRTGLGFGGPLESITYAKLRKLRQLTAQWLASEQHQADEIRLDAIGVLLIPGTAPELTHVRGIG